MARAILAATTSARTSNGTLISWTSAAADGHSVDNTKQNVIILVKNDSGGDVVVTFTTVTEQDGLSLPDLTGTVSAGQIRAFGFFNHSTYGSTDADNSSQPTSKTLLIDTDVQTDISYIALVGGAA